MTVPFHSGDHRAAVDGDVLHPFDPVHQVAGHAGSPGPLLAAPRAPGWHIGQKRDGLAGRVPAADDHDLLALALLGLHLGGGVIDAGALEITEAGHVEPAILHPARHQDAAGAEPGSIGQGNRPGHRPRFPGIEPWPAP